MGTGRAAVAWSARRGRCAATAALGALAGALAVAGVVPLRWLPAVLVLTAFAVPLAAVDLAVLRLPDVLTLSAYPVFGAAAVLAEPTAWQRILLGAVVLGGAHLVVAVLAPRALGGGDVKLAGALGLLLGARGWPALLLFAPLAAACTALLAGFRARRHPAASDSAAVPHGPGLLAACWLLVTL